MPKMSGAQFMADALHAYGVTHIFFVPTILSHSLAQMDERGTGIARVLTHGEKAAAYMADGYARASGRPGVCMAQIVGGVNLAAGLRDAHLACAPLIAFTGGTTPQIRYRNAYQETEDISAFDPVTKFNATVDDVTRFPDLLRQAFRVATSGTPGPVHLRFGGNLGQVEQDVADLELIVEENFRKVPAYRPEPEPASIAHALEVIAKAERPIIVAGGGVRTSGANAELVALAEKLQIPVATSMNGKETIPGDHPLSVGVVGTYSRRSANELVSEADLVFFIGTQTGGMTTHFWRVPKIGVKAVQLDIDPEELGRNYPLEASIMGDAKISLGKLIEAAEEVPARAAWLSRVEAVGAAWRAEFAPLLNSDASPMRPERVCKTLGEHLPSDAIVLADTGHSGMWTGGYLDLKSPDVSFMRAAGHLGWGFPAALGAKCGAPERPVVLFTGDAGFWYHIGEVETAVRWGINAVILVNNNGSQNQETKIFDDAYGGEQRGKAHELWHFNQTNFTEIAKSMGAASIRVEKPGELGSALDQAFSMKGGPVILDVVTDIEALAPGAYGPPG
ncbi:MAG: thiamine pyrophosphate-binding protein [Nitrospinae bacterium]|nr:thiamine pyrophosphate-binding protein [Nitrospinota bacterium]